MPNNNLFESTLAVYVSKCGQWLVNPHMGYHIDRLREDWKPIAEAMTSRNPEAVLRKLLRMKKDDVFEQGFDMAELPRGELWFERTPFLVNHHQGDPTTLCRVYLPRDCDEDLPLLIPEHCAFEQELKGSRFADGPCWAEDGGFVVMPAKTDIGAEYKLMRSWPVV